MKIIMILCLSIALLISLASTSLASTSSEVIEAQRCLAVLGFDPGPIDGAIGSRTADAFARYGASRGLSLTVDPEAVGPAVVPGVLCAPEPTTDAYGRGGRPR